MGRGLTTYTPRGSGLLAVDLFEHLPQFLLEVLGFDALVVFAHEVPACHQGVARKLEGGETEVLERPRQSLERLFVSARPAHEPGHLRYC